MAYSTITYETTGNIIRIVMNRPGVMNAIDGTMKQELLQALKQASQDSAATVVVLTGAGRAFSTGVDLKDQAYNPWPHSPEGWGGHFDTLVASAKEMWNMDIPVVAAVKGFCLGAGCDLALAADFVLASEDAKFGEPEIRHGAFAPTLIVPWILGMRKAKEFLMLGATIEANEAKELGLVNEVFPNTTFDDDVERWISTITKVPRHALKTAKKAINKGYELMGIWEAIQYNRELTTLLAMYRTAQEREARNELIRQKGLKAFLTERDKKFE